MFHMKSGFSLFSVLALYRFSLETWCLYLHSTRKEKTVRVKVRI